MTFPHDPASPASSLADEQLLERLRVATLGEYDIFGELGRGGMATVFLAHEISPDRKVAIKVMSPALLHGAGMVERFKREARTAAYLSHPNIIPVYAVREAEGLLFFVMKLVEGTPLDAIIKELGKLPLPMVEAILAQIGGAFGYAHRHGVVHRDIKPSNILIDDEGWAVVTDFGIAKMQETEGLTLTGMAVGTPTYMSPEQCGGGPITGASDQYAMGIVAYEMLGHGNHFLPELIAGNSAIIGFLTDAIGVNASNLPLSASSSGQTFRFVGGLPVKTSASLGPVFGERAQTVGRGRFVVGANITGVKFSSLRGVPLEKLVLNFTHDDVAGVGRPGLGDPEKENDILQVRLDMGVSLLVSTFFATYGLSDGLDLSIAVPLVHTSLTGRSTAQIYPFGGPTSVHFFTGSPDNPGLIANAATFGSVTSIGDIAVRLKANVRTNERLGMAFMADVRLPTGSEEDFTGAGHLALRGLAIVSGRFGDFSPHLNVGYMLRTGEGRKDALIYPFVRTVEPTNIPEMKDHRVSGSFGFKFRTPGGPILVTNALVPLRRGGLQSNLVWTVGLDMNF